MKNHQHILVAIVENEPGVLNRISSLFRRRRFNIESISAGYTEKKGITRITIVVNTGDTDVEQVMKQLYKIVPVIKVRDVTHDNILAAEVVMVKVKADMKKRGDIQQIADLFKAKIVHVEKKQIMMLASGERDKINSFLDLIKPFGIIEMVRTGVTAMNKDINL
ncbi:acetolactate synthase small subunit [Patescibacteria group bacterium]